MRQEWFSAAEIAEQGLPGMPATKASVILMARRLGWADPSQQGVTWRTRQGRGGGVEYHFSLLPSYAKQKLVVRLHGVDAAAVEQARAQSTCTDIWAWWDRLPESVKERGRYRLKAIHALKAMLYSGTSKTVAVQLVAVEYKITASTLYNWEGLIAGRERHDWLSFLTPRHVGRTSTADCAPEAWEVLKADYLRPERPNFSDCYRRLLAIAAKKGWAVPSEDTLLRRMNALPRALTVKERHGEAALKALYPSQQRDRSVFHALQAVNADGHKWDIFVQWPDGDVSRVVMVAFQDLYSGKFLSWRVDRTENRECVRLAFGDMIERYGIPEECYLDNGRNFASKWLTGGTRTRFRFKVRDDEPAGIMTQLGVHVHWTTPYSGQSKPIERGFRDFAQSIAKHPALAGAWTGNTPLNKPENHGAHAVPLDLFLRTIGDGIAEHNARLGRRSVVCAGERSFDQAFEASYAQATIRKAAPEQRRLWLMAAESILVQRDGAVMLEGNRFWDARLHDHIGQRIVARFDPEQLQEPLHVYTLDGRYVCAAECQVAAGFNDVAAAREHGRQRRDWMRGVRMMAKAEKSLTIAQVAALQPACDEPPAPQTKVVRPLFGGGALAREPQADADEELSEFNQAFVQHARAARAARGDHLRVVEEDD